MALMATALNHAPGRQQVIYVEFHDARVAARSRRGRKKLAVGQVAAEGGSGANLFRRSA
jgi:hypothetical protein